MYRELNKEADALVNLAMDSGNSSALWGSPPAARPRRVRACYDGGVRNELLSACGWILQASWDEPEEQPQWTDVAWASLLLPAGTTVNDAELTGCEQATSAMLIYAAGNHIRFDSDLRIIEHR